MPEPPTIRPVLVDSPEALAVIRAYTADIIATWHGRPAADDEVEAFLADSPNDALAPPHGAFYLADHQGRTVGCVGVRWLDEETAEVKRMYVDPGARGLGLGQALLATVEDAARAAGRRWMVLDTNGSLVAARALYGRAGYAEVPPYNDNPHAEHWFRRALQP